MRGDIINIPLKPTSLQKLEWLEKRKKLSSEDNHQRFVLQKGYEGERNFSCVLQELLPPHALVLYDLLLEWQNSYFQIDCLIVSRGVLYLFEIKNYDGSYYYQDDHFYLLKQKKQIKNPLHQLQRCEHMLHDLLESISCNHSIHPYLLFVNPSFMPYQAPVQFDMIYPGQIRSFIQKLSENYPHPAVQDKEVAELLAERHIPHNKFAYRPNYEHAALQKGLFSLCCNAVLYKKNRKKMQCKKCSMEENFDSAVLRGVVEFACLFPREAITSRKIYEWCNCKIPRRRIADIMKKFMIASGKTTATTYRFREIEAFVR